MGRNKKLKTVSEQIAAKENMVKELEDQLKQAKDELKALKQAQTIEEVEVLHKYIVASNLTPEKAIEILQTRANEETE